MSEMISSLVGFLAILNPFALCLYLVGVMEDLDWAQFLRVLGGACLMSAAVFALFALAGETLLTDLLGIHPAAMRIFGGAIFLIVGYNYVVKGYRAAEMLRGSLEALPSAIALPFMIGAGTLTQSILIGKQHPAAEALAVLVAGILVSFAAVVLFKLFRDRVHGVRERLYDRWVNIFARINGLVIGALSTEMIVWGVRDLWGA